MVMTGTNRFLAILVGALIWSSFLMTDMAIAQETDPEIVALLEANNLPADSIISDDGMLIIDGVAIPLELLQGDLDDIAPEAAGVSEAIWLEMPIPVCWESMDAAYAEGRSWTRDAVEKSWAKVSDVSFTDWQGCEETSRGIRIEVSEMGPHVDQLGKGLDGLPGGMTLNFTFAGEWGKGCADFKEDCIRSLAVHEFGHAIGLAHEHNRDDRQLCAQELQGPRPTFTVTSYDPTSVMNYCAKEWNNGGRLSALDVAGALMIYGPFSDETPATGKIRLAVDYREPEGKTVRASYEFSPTLAEVGVPESETVTECIGGTHAVNLNAASALVSGKAIIAVSLTTNLIEAPDCQPSDLVLDSQTFDFQLTEPFSDGGAAVELGLGGYYNIVSFDEEGAGWSDLTIQVLAYREIGEEVISETCTRCLAASKEAVFGPDKKPDTVSGHQGNN